MSVVLGVGAFLAVLAKDPHLIAETELTTAGVFGVGLGSVAWLAIGRQPRNGAVWALLGSGFFSSLLAAGELTVILLARRSVPGFTLFGVGDFSLSDLPTPLAWVLFPAAWAWIPALFLILTLGLMLFPDGRAPSRRWRWLGWYNGAVIAVVAVANAWLFDPASTVPFGVSSEKSVGVAGSIANGGFGFLALGALLSIVAVFVRYRRSAGTERRQIRWIAWGAGFILLSSVATSVLASIMENGTDTSDVAFIIGEIGLISSFAVAITKYRLYDIDVVMSKTVTYLSLAVVVAALYGAAVLGLISLFGDSNQRGGDVGLVLPLGATALVAVVFEPLLVRLQRFANRLVYGKRAAPYEILSQLTSRLSDTSGSEGTMGLARLLREGTGAEGAVVWLRVGDRLRVEAVSPAEWSASDLASEGGVSASELEASVPVRHGGELLGALGITKPRTRPVTPADETLLGDVAAGAGLMLRNLRLNAELGERAAEIRASRRRLISAQDASRHRLERDLHDGAQQQVVALKVKLGLAKTIAEREGADDVAARVADMSDGIQQAVDAMRVVARGIYPPLLEAEGLGAALGAAQRTSDVSVQIDAGHLPRYSKQLEETVYFCVVAALVRAKMAGAASAHAEVRPGDTSLTVTVTYDSADRGDLTQLADRVDAFGGTVTTTSSPSDTTLTVELPLEDEAMEPQSASVRDRFPDGAPR
jgi:signal transduction histidine kinase